jgi:glycerophosphoryl diester phosphodiesterase
MLIVGHRGASYDAPENTLPALRLAWEQGADAVEFDVRLTRDGEVVLLHDESTRRTAGLDALLHELDLDQVRRLDAGSWKGQEWAGEGIPTLEVALETVPPGREVFVEIKSGLDTVPSICEVLRGFDAGRVSVVGFSLDVMKAAAAALPECDCYWNVDLASCAWTVGAVTEEVRRAGLRGLGPGWTSHLDESFVAGVKEAGLRLFVWTVDDPEVARCMRGWGLDALVTNRPGWIRMAMD